MGLELDRRRVALGVGGCVALALCLLYLWALAAAPARADSTVNVNTTNAASTMGDGLCSLPEAVTYADGTAEPDCAPGTASGTTTINVPANTTTLTSTLSITKNTTIDGAGASSTTIDGGGNVEVLSIAAGATVTISGVTISGGTTGNTGGCTGNVFISSCPSRDGLNGGGIANAGTLTLKDSTVTGNDTSPGLDSSSFNRFVSCTPADCAASPGASAGNGGDGAGIYNSGQITITDSTISHNTAGPGGSGTAGYSGAGSGASAAGEHGGSAGFGGFGGGIYNDSAGTATITNSTIDGNAAGTGGDGGAGSDATASGNAGGDAGFPEFGGQGGGLMNLGTMTVTGSTISGNNSGTGGKGAGGGAGDGAAAGFATNSASGGLGGGVDNASTQTLTLADSTITGNTAAPGGTGGAGPGAPGTGAGINQNGSGLVATTFVTIEGNNAAGTGGAINSSGPVTETDSIIAANTGSPAKNCGSTVTDDGHNVVFGDNSCPGAAADPKLGPLASNGGPTQTMDLQAGSAATDAVPDNACPLTTDQRGVTRPQGSACDAGAYELAPPSLSGVAGTTGSTTGATVTANVNPNFKAATVSVAYGTTTAYGSATAAQILTGNSATPFSTILSGLAPNTTYHAQVTASNGDGTTRSGDVSFTTPASLSASVISASTTGTQLALTIACSHGNPGDKCAGPVTLSAHVKTQAGKTVAVTAKAKPKPKPKKKPKPKPTKTTSVTLATGSYSIASGQRTTLKLSLNATGKKLLTALYRVPTTMTIGGTASVTKTVTFSYGRITSPVSFTWAFNAHFSVAQELAISGLPSKSKVAVNCHGHGCPFSKRTFSPKGKKLSLLPEFKHSHLVPHTTLQLEISAANHVTKVLTFTIRSGEQPTLAESCQPPGARKPTACA